MASRTLAASAGWKLYGPTWIQICAPNLSVPSPGTTGNSSRMTDQAERVGVAVQRTVIPQQDGDQDEQDHPDRSPDQLLSGPQGRWRVDQVDPVDHRQPETVQHHHAGQQHRIGVREAPADSQMGHQGPTATPAGTGNSGDRVPVALKSTWAYAPRVTTTRR